MARFSGIFISDPDFVQLRCGSQHPVPSRLLHCHFKNVLIDHPKESIFFLCSSWHWPPMVPRLASCMTSGRRRETNTGLILNCAAYWMWNLRKSLNLYQAIFFSYVKWKIYMSLGSMCIKDDNICKIIGLLIYVIISTLLLLLSCFSIFKGNQTYV